MTDPREFVDLTQMLDEGSLSYPGTMSGIALERVDSGIPEVTLTHLAHLDMHCGTHLDAPLHFIPTGCDVTAIPLGLPEIVLVRSQERQIPLQSLRGLPSLRGKAVLFTTGWEQHAGTASYFSGFPSLCPELAAALVDRGASVVGIDSPSVDPASGPFAAHRLLLGGGIPILEGLVQLEVLSERLAAGRTARLIAFPLRIRSLDGSPVRAVAWLTRRTVPSPS